MQKKTTDMSHSKSVADYKFAREDRLLLDTNVWVFVYGPRKPSDSRVSIYSEAYKRILEAKSVVHINIILISEIINAIVQSYSNLERFGRVKDFVNSAKFLPVAEEVANIIRRISKKCLPLDDGLASIQIDSIIDDYAQGKCGFNDRVLAYLCKRERLTLVTDDADFGGSDITILTANQSVLDRPP